ncbi:lipopolysaccharide biosynthesis protein [Butyrivibrio hungatei]|uniref:lipopolysaccharide biosynthesis protein n=1 Tax=Butyrivibrio hungatei TaxID=185008 RepID=UPI000419AD38|nr:lipopolysaccharide biosynthesis protein [Butyrivibrio hungatei]
MSTGNKKKVITNFIWRFLERIGAQGVSFVVSIVLGRILDRDVYGTVALVTVITAILQVLVDSGLGNALIQKKDADHLDFSSVFYFNICACAILYMGMFFAAPFIAAFYRENELTALVRVLSITIIISGVKNVQQAYVSRKMIFKKFFFSTIGGTFVSAVAGIWMALRGYGVWALVAQIVINPAVDTIILWITVDFRPRAEFSFKRLKGLFSYGWKLLASAMLNTGFENIRGLVIGKINKVQLADFNRGQQFPTFIINNINTSISSVLLPTMSEEQDDITRIKAMTRRAIKTSTYFMAPAMLGLAACSDIFIKLLLTEKWLPAVPFLIIFCIVDVFYPIATANLNAMMAIGRSDLFLKLEIIKKTSNLLILLITVRHGVMAITYGMIVAEFIGQVVNAWPNKKLIGYSYCEQMLDILPTLMLSAVMAAVVYCIRFLNINLLAMLLIQIVAGVVFYILGSVIFRFETFSYVLGIIKDWKKQ